jgi:hypothetical protein
VRLGGPVQTAASGFMNWNHHCPWCGRQTDRNGILPNALYIFMQFLGAAAGVKILKRPGSQNLRSYCGHCGKRCHWF